MNILWDKEEKSIRGSFVNLLITIIYLTLLVYGAFNPEVAENLFKMETLLIGVFVTSLGLWAGKKISELAMNGKKPTATIDEAAQRAREREAAK